MHTKLFILPDRLRYAGCMYIGKNMPTRALSEIHELISRAYIILLSVFPDKACSRHVLTYLYPGK